jgi:hypothetical protein
MLVEATLLGLAILTWKKLGKKPEWTAEHEEMYVSALEHLKGPAGVAKMLEIADTCEKEGFPVKAAALRKRAALRGTDDATKRARRAAFDKGMQSVNVQGILRLAKTFEDISATGAAGALRDHARDVEAGTFRPDPEAVPQQPATAATRAAPQTIPSPPPSESGLPPEAAAVEEDKAAIPPVVAAAPPQRKQEPKAKRDSNGAVVHAAVVVSDAPPTDQAT